MKSLVIDEQNARQYYNTPDPSLKSKLDEVFGKEFFTVKITDQVKTVEDALALRNLTVANLSNDSDTPDEIAYKVIKTVITILNEGWEPDWNNKAQNKYQPFWINKNGKLVFNDVIYWCQYSRVGSRLCYHSRTLCEFGVKLLEKYYDQFNNR